MTDSDNIMDIESNTGLQAAEIAAQNDLFRRSIIDAEARYEASQKGIFGRLMLTRGVCADLDKHLHEVQTAVAGFDRFTEDNDPYGDHSFGVVTVAGERLFWKLDLYDTEYRYGSERPYDPSVTRRVLTILKPSEY